MAQRAQTISSIAEPSRRATAAHKALRSLDGHRDELIAIRRQAVHELRATGWSWQDIADLLGIHRNRAAHLLQPATTKSVGIVTKVPTAT